MLVFLRHTGSPDLPARLLKLLSDVTPKAAWLDAKKVPSARRETWINKHVLARGVEVLLVNPKRGADGAQEVNRLLHGFFSRPAPSGARPKRGGAGMGAADRRHTYISSDVGTARK